MNYNKTKCTAIWFPPGVPFHDMQDNNSAETWWYITDALQKNYPDLAYDHFVEPRSMLYNDDSNMEDISEPFCDLWKSPL